MFVQWNACETASEKCKSRSRYIILGFLEYGADKVGVGDTGGRFSAKIARTQSAT